MTDEKDGHVHGCGHRVRPVVLCDNPLCIIASEYLDWNDEHHQAVEKGEKCICYFCWKERRSKGMVRKDGNDLS